MINTIIFTIGICILSYILYSIFALWNYKEQVKILKTQLKAEMDGFDQMHKACLDYASAFKIEQKNREILSNIITNVLKETVNDNQPITKSISKIPLN